METCIEKPYLVLTEGHADRAFLKYLLTARGADKHDFDFFENVDKYGGGNTSFEAYLKGTQLERGFEKVKAILIVTDCDADPAKSFENVQKQIQAAGYSVPDKPLELVKTDRKPALCVVTIPFDNSPGHLETYILKGMQTQWAAERTSTDRHIQDTSASGWIATTQDKARVQCMIAVIHQEDPNKSLRYIWGKNPDFSNMLKDDATFNDLFEFLTNFPTMLEELNEAKAAAQN